MTSFFGLKSKNSAKKEKMRVRVRLVWELGGGGNGREGILTEGRGGEIF